MRTRGRRALAGAAASLLLATACQASSAPPTPAAPAAPAVQTGAVGAQIGTNPSIAPGWKRPLDVAPAAEEGKFKVMAQEPAPGDKVRVFFLGAQF